jgi:hypothetical protein
MHCPHAFSNKGKGIAEYFISKDAVLELGSKVFLIAWGMSSHKLSDK